MLLRSHRQARSSEGCSGRSRCTGWTTTSARRWCRCVRSVQYAACSVQRATSNMQRVALYHWLAAAVGLQNLITMRFSNILFEPMWNAKFVSAVLITFKEGFGTHGE